MKECQYSISNAIALPRTLQDYRDKSIIPYTQIAGKILYRLSDINQLLQENYQR